MLRFDFCPHCLVFIEISDSKAEMSFDRNGIVWIRRWILLPDAELFQINDHNFIFQRSFPDLHLHDGHGASVNHETAQISIDIFESCLWGVFAIRIDKVFVFLKMVVFDNASRNAGSTSGCSHSRQDGSRAKASSGSDSGADADSSTGTCAATIATGSRANATANGA